jgi:hypothetical protein
MFCQVDRQFLPAVANITTEPAWLVLWLFSGVATASFNNGPNVVCLPLAGCKTTNIAHLTLVASSWGIFINSSGTLTWLSNLMLADKVLHEIVFAIACVVAISDLARPVL